jgi:hypothetical protein
MLFLIAIDPFYELRIARRAQFSPLLRLAMATEGFAGLHQDENMVPRGLK